MKEEYDILSKVSELRIGPKHLTLELSSNPDLVRAYIKYAISQKKHAWRASWVLSHYSEENNLILQKHTSQFIESLKIIEVNGHIRENLKIIYNLELTEDQTGEVFDICLNLFEDNRKQPSVRMIAFNFLYRVAKDYPELHNEILIIFENIKEYLSPGIRNSMRVRLQKIKTN